MQLMNYRTAVIKKLSEITSIQWERLRAAQRDRQGSGDNPFLSYAYLSALEESGCACAETGWDTHFLTLWQGDELHAALPLYLKSHSFGEYVFDWAWANAYEQHDLAYYPKLLSAIPFTPVTGMRILARDEAASGALLNALDQLTATGSTSSCHILFATEQQAQQCQAAGFMLRTGIQFHWTNQGYHDFSDFLSHLSTKKRKNIMAERRKIRDAGIYFSIKVANQIKKPDWLFFYECYKNTYRQRGRQEYLNLDFFLTISATMPDNLVMITALRNNLPIAAALLFQDEHSIYGRYWGCTEYHPCLHFETAYYQPLTFCIANRIRYFEGGAQGEHKMARGFLPETTYSLHRLNHPAFSDAVERFLIREQQGITQYIDELNEHNPFASS